MFDSSTFKDYKNQRSWGRITGTLCYVVAVLVAAFGLGIFFISSRKDQLPTILGYCQIISAQFLGAGAILYGSSKATESFVAAKSSAVGGSVAAAVSNKTTAIVSAVTAKTETLLEHVETKKDIADEDDPAPRINLNG